MLRLLFLMTLVFRCQSMLLLVELGDTASIPCGDTLPLPHENRTDIGVANFAVEWRNSSGFAVNDETVDAFSGLLRIPSVGFADSGNYTCTTQVPDGIQLRVTQFSHILQVYEEPLNGRCQCGCQMIDDLCLGCPPGYYGEDGKCHPCAIGRYNPYHGASCCLNCPAFHITWGHAATERLQCSGAVHDYVLGFGLLAALALCAHGFYKFCGPIFLEAVRDYLEEEPLKRPPPPPLEVPHISEERLDIEPPDDTERGFCARFSTRTKSLLQTPHLHLRSNGRTTLQYVSQMKRTTTNNVMTLTLLTCPHLSLYILFPLPKNLLRKKR
ncbi:uncharacterized protein LOC135365815 isoform X2 [Ornithodoros turicata]|uniref:uncharacterized protein LOC135365815 isoform X2 n=1 Tax=Ornithodoros turicata TaxID=34597 RepID=UPI0031388DDF